MSLTRPRAGYLILTHHDIPQAERLIASILSMSPQARVLVAHDGRRHTAPVIDDDRVRIWVHGRATDWGSWELVAVTLEGFRLLREWADPDVSVLASGQDYVCGDLEAWHRRFTDGGGGWVGAASPLAYRPRWGRTRGQGDDTWTRYHFRWYDVPSVVDRMPTARGAAAARRIRDAVFLRIEPLVSYRVMERARRRLVGLRWPTQSLFGGRPVYKGQQWLAMDRALLAKVLATAGADSRLARHYRRSVIPDESFVQTILSWEQPPRSDLDLMFVGWDSTTDEARYLTTDDLPALRASRAILCRKVSSQAGASLCDALDREYA